MPTRIYKTVLIFYIFMLVVMCKNGFSEEKTAASRQPIEHKTVQVETAPAPGASVTNQTYKVEPYDIRPHIIDTIREYTGINFPMILFFPISYDFEYLLNKSDICVFAGNVYSNTENTMLFAASKSEKLTDLESLYKTFDFSKLFVVVVPAAPPKGYSGGTAVALLPLSLKMAEAGEVVPLSLNNSRTINGQKVKLDRKKQVYNKEIAETFNGIQCNLEINKRYCYLLIYSQNDYETIKRFIVDILNGLFTNSRIESNGY